MSGKLSSSKLMIELFDDGWNVDEGIVPAPPPDHNVKLVLPASVAYAVRSAWEALDIVYYENPDETDGAYFIMKAPEWEGTLYDSMPYNAQFRGEEHVFFVIDFDSVLYVLEDADSCTRMTYDITEYFTNKK